MRGEMKLKSPGLLDRSHLVGARCELWQQSILKSTWLVATTEGLTGNTPFSAQSHNNLTANKLSQQEYICRLIFNILSCETCLTVGRNMVFRASKHGLSRCGQVGIAKRKMPNGTRKAQSRDGEYGKSTVSLAGSTKNATQLLHQNIKQSISHKGWGR